MRYQIDWNALEQYSPEVRAQVEDELKQLEQLYEDNPLERFVPYPKQKQFLAADTRLKAFFAGNQAGKSTIGVIDDLIQAVDEDCLPEQLRQFKKWQPPFYCRVITPDLMGTLQVVLEKFREWAPKSQLRGASFDKAYEKANRVLRFQNGSYISFMSNDQDRDKHGGASLHRVHYDEEPFREIRGENRKRIMAFRGDEIFTMTPLKGLSWTHDEIYLRAVRDKDLSLAVIQGATWENPYIHPDELTALAKEYTKEELQAVIEGRFVHFAGLVLPEFTHKRHVIEALPPEDIKRYREVIVGIDPGIRRSGVVWVAFTKDNQAVVFDELYLENSTVPMIASAIKAKNKQYGISPFYYIDPSARNRSIVNAEQPQAAFNREGIFPIPAQNSIESGVFEIKRRLQANPPALRVTENCTNWLWEASRYRYKERPDKAFETVDGDDHLMDPTRYVLLARVWYSPEPDQSTKSSGYQHNVAPPFQAPEPEYGPMGFMN